MKAFLVIVCATVGVLLVGSLIAWGVIAGSRSYWQAGCESDGYVVRSHGYGISKNYQCIDPATGNYVDTF